MLYVGAYVYKVLFEPHCSKGRLSYKIFIHFLFVHNKSNLAIHLHNSLREWWKPLLATQFLSFADKGSLDLAVRKSLDCCFTFSLVTPNITKRLVDSCFTHSPYVSCFARETAPSLHKKGERVLNTRLKGPSWMRVFNATPQCSCCAEEWVKVTNGW